MGFRSQKGSRSYLLDPKWPEGSGFLISGIGFGPPLDPTRANPATPFALSHFSLEMCDPNANMTPSLDARSEIERPKGEGFDDMSMTLHSRQRRYQISEKEMWHICLRLLLFSYSIFGREPKNEREMQGSKYRTTVSRM